MRLVPLGVGMLLLGLAVAATAAPVPQTKTSPAAKAAASAARPIDLNAATASQLEALPGIGPATAKRIVEYREKNGGFKKIEELMNVRGIGEKSFLKLKSLVTVTPPRAKAVGSRAPVAA
jgi:competence protein ComEA